MRRRGSRAFGVQAIAMQADNADAAAVVAAIERAATAWCGHDILGATIDTPPVHGRRAI
jgi:hypothetical protein